MPAAPLPASPLGVGIDLAERNTFGHLDPESIRRAAGRWLRPAERAWCEDQPCFREAVGVVLCCKEALYKAWGESDQVHDLALAMSGRCPKGRAVRVDPCPTQAVAAWRVVRGSILAVAVAAGAPARRREWSILPRGRDTPADQPGHEPLTAVPKHDARTG
jgi:hypothetical protein